MTKLDFSLNLSESLEKLMAIAMDFENTLKYMPPNQVKSIKIVEKSENRTTTEEILTFEAIKFQEIIQQTVHTVMLPNKIRSEVIMGPFTGTKIDIIYEKTEFGTKVNVDADLKLSLKYKILSPLIKSKYKQFISSILYKMNTQAAN